jgi:hypothetical protein
MVWTLSIGPRNPTIMSSQTLLVLLIMFMLSHNHQNHNYSLIGPCLLQSPCAYTGCSNITSVLGSCDLVCPYEFNLQPSNHHRASSKLAINIFAGLLAELDEQRHIAMWSLQMLYAVSCSTDSFILL